MRFILLVLCLYPFSLFAGSEPKIQASIRPLQSIIVNLTKGIDNIGIIVEQNESIHNCYLKPTKARTLYNSKMVIIIDTNFEVFLKKALDNLNPRTTQIIEVAKLPGVKILEDDESHQHGGEGHHHHHGLNDYHIWLDIDNVKAISIALTDIFIKNNSSKAAKYKDNLNKFLTKLNQLDIIIKAQMNKVEGYKFIVSHNAYQYYISRYNLENPQAISIDHDHNIGAREFIKIQNSIRDNEVKCVFEEPQFESKIIDKIKKDSNVKVCKLDAEWGPEKVSVEDSYIEMMTQVSNSFYSCLQ